MLNGTVRATKHMKHLKKLHKKTHVDWALTSILQCMAT
ncbi:hypothetical protein BLL52_3807 [Rhodoferax antarcticus ANT.BR]|uniref:Uncharacterized protein n=1 Tax=Rhodoferax antarcticus ANT.BR TaxID=1111071 RepID=A0A1Q8YAH8_9BURK|nr:hypothetical protein BLL52_3807 [Rhodoferax antarcticus ANT.BR]